MMKVIILEDEAPAAERLKKMLRATSFGVEVLGVLPTVASAVAWLGANPLPDLIFMDIQLGDGLSVDLVKRVRIDCPVCHTPMIRMVDLKNRKVWYESCPVCYGVFYDAGEFREHKEHHVFGFFRDLFDRKERK